MMMVEDTQMWQESRIAYQAKYPRISYQAKYPRIFVMDSEDYEHMVEVFRGDGHYLGTFPKSLISALFHEVGNPKDALSVDGSSWKQLEFDLGPEFA